MAAMDVNGVVCVDSTTDSVNGDAFCDFLECSLLPQLLPFNGTNPRSIVFLIVLLYTMYRMQLASFRVLVH